MKQCGKNDEMEIRGKMEMEMEMDVEIEEK